MEHNHSHDHDHTANIKIAFFLNLLFTLIEIIGGILTNSVAILSDALHDFGDTIALGSSWYFQKLAAKERTNNFSYGYKRFSLFSAFVNSIILIIGSLYILSEAITRLMHPESTNARGMFLISILGIAINLLAVLRVKNGKTLNERVVTWHLLEDVLGWILVFIVSFTMIFVNLPVLDPLLSIILTAYILFNVLKNLKAVVNVFLQAVPQNIDIVTLEDEIFKVENVVSVHDTHAWSMDGEYNVLTTHIVVKDIPEEKIHNTKYEIKKILHTLGISHSTIEVERVGEDCELVHC